MAVGAFDVTGWIDWIFRRVMYARCIQDRVGAELVEFGLDVFRGDRATMADVAVFFLVRPI